MNIPKIFHQIWYQGEQNIPEHLQQYRNSWIQKHPQYVFMLWDQQKIEKLVSSFDLQIQNLYYSYKLMIQRIDFAKYIILFAFGGIYIDMDVKCIKPIDQLLMKYYDKNVILSFCPYDFFHQSSMVCIGLYPGEPLINNGIIMCSKNHIALQNILKQCLDNKDSIFSIFGKNFFHIFATTGPVMVTQAIRNTSKNDLIILDHSYFEACDIQNVKIKCDLPDHAIGLHVYEGSWVSPFEKNITQFYFFLKDYFFILVLFIVLFYLI